MTDVLDTLTGPGGPFEVVTEDVRGVPLQVYKNRLHSMRDLIDMSNGRGETDFMVQGDRRVSYAGHNARVRATAAAHAQKATTHSGLLAESSATRSPRCTPRAVNPAAVARTRALCPT